MCVPKTTCWCDLRASEKQAKYMRDLLKRLGTTMFEFAPDDACLCGCDGVEHCPRGSAQKVLNRLSTAIKRQDLKNKVELNR